MNFLIENIFIRFLLENRISTKRFPIIDESVKFSFKSCRTFSYLQAIIWNIGKS